MWYSMGIYGLFALEYLAHRLASPHATAPVIGFGPRSRVFTVMASTVALTTLGIIALDAEPSGVTEPHHLDVASLGILNINLELATLTSVGAYGFAQLHCLAVVLGFI
jgi:hypothetical protein